MNTVQVIAIEGLPLSREGDNIGQLIVNTTKTHGIQLQERDIIVVTHVFVSKAEGNIVNLDTVEPSKRAFEIAKQTNKDPALVEVILREAKDIVKVGPNSIITETKSGTISANSGVDRSNVSGERNVVLLPKDPSRSAQNIRIEIKRLTGINVAVIVSDTHGRPFRIGEINVAIGAAGIKPIRDRRGEKDLFGYTLQIKQTAIADELASAAELVMGQANEGIPAAIIRGYTVYQSVEDMTSSVKLVRPKEKDLFR
ncbi:MAG: coenzyme F420-0:L-glutamate ligase [Nitrososphaerota archaeon]|jgi:coenzyme F420-0:L-glutamate ligase/coenzyme F420-1:gamma-L-glutamate ligase|nr:coenzyme F420-0:L-glutamate ligase [Nitrososphaerota archaeon]